MRLVLLACAVRALLDGAAWEAAGLFMLAVFLPSFGLARPLGLRVWWWGGGWRI